MRIRIFITLLLFFAGCERSNYLKPDLIRGPFLRHITSHSAVIVYTVNVKGNVKARYGKRGALNLTWKGESLPIQNGEYGYYVCVRLEGLEPDTVYSFEPDVTNSSLISFRTFPEGITELKFVIFGDNRTQLNIFNEIVKRIEDVKPDLIFHTGDMVEFGSLYYGQGLVGWDDFINAISTLYRTTPFYIAFGNHDRGGEEIFSSYFPPIYEGNSPYFYSFDLAGVHFIVLNSEEVINPSSQEVIWLDADLSNVESDFKIVFIHRPPFSSSHHGKLAEEGREEEIINIRENVVPILENHGVDVVFAGHEHNYERTYPLKGGEIDPNGIIYVITGGGGAPLYDRELEFPGSYTFVKTYHYVVAEKTGKVIEFKAVALNGEIIDSFEVRK